MKTYHFKLQGEPETVVFESGSLGSAITRLSSKHAGKTIEKAWHGVGGPLGGAIELFELAGKTVPPKQKKDPKPIASEFGFLEEVDAQCGKNSKNSAQKAGL